MEDYRQRMAAKIRHEREKAGLSEAELAWKVHASERQVRRWEGGESVPRPATLRALASYFKIKITDIRPDVEEEERAVLAQLNRIEAKLDALLATQPAVGGPLRAKPLQTDSRQPKQKRAR